MLNLCKKIKIFRSSHLCSGNNNWHLISNNLKYFFNSENSKINCYEWLDKNLKNQNLDKNWIGFLHNTITYPDQYPNKYHNKIQPLSKLIKNNYFLDSLSDCLGIFVFTNEIKNYLIKNLNFPNIEYIVHPCLEHKEKWNSFNCLLHVGQQLRKYHSFINLETELLKTIIIPKNCENDLIEAKQYYSKRQKLQNLQYVNQLDSNDYIKKLCNSVVFLDLYDVAACNTILECIMLNTPILVNKLPGCVEYLGVDYPFYFENLEEAEKKLRDYELIKKTNLYLSKLDKTNFKINNFLYNFCNTNIYKKL